MVYRITLEIAKCFLLLALLLFTCCGNINNSSGEAQGRQTASAQSGEIQENSLRLDASQTENISEISEILSEAKADAVQNALLQENGETFIDLAFILERAGFSKSVLGADVLYKKADCTLVFNGESKSIAKDIFTYYLSDSSVEKDAKLFVSERILEKILGKRIIITYGGAKITDDAGKTTGAEKTNEAAAEISFEEFTYETHSWLNLSKSLVAHACGGIIGINGGNSQEALVTNYNNGHEVFEIDFRLTSDGEIAAIHGWDGYGGVRAHEDFKKIKYADVFTTMDFDDILRIMQLNKEIYIITDTKSFEDSDEYTRQMFETLRDKAENLDKTLMKRIVPQIYNQQMYSLIKEIYPFESIVYTLYMSPDTDAEVVDFVKNREDIAAITMGPVRYSEEFYKALTENGKFIYFFTLNDIDEVKGYLENGIHGIYTDFILPGDLL
ncbi:MAG: hypothetical protein LBS21_02730 [Clostridiales bacterium]|jgi:glycerophosphoryl diester phosphodiesterase|nr:hypothetical protein [Clostridiales bacterium]